MVAGTQSPGAKKLHIHEIIRDFVVQLHLGEVCLARHAHVAVVVVI